MNVSLPKDLEAFVLQEIAAGAYPDTIAVVADALRKLQGTADLGPLPDDCCPPELKELLLEAIHGPHHPLPATYFNMLR